MHKLRGHHLICLQFFKGQGYDRRFVDNLQNVLTTIDVVEVVDGIDDICIACPYNAGFCNYSENSEKEVRELDMFALKLLGLETGARIKWRDLKAEVPKILEKWKKFACKDCEWRGICDV